MFGYYFISAVFLGFITVVDQGLEQAIGIHAATNIYGAVIVGYQGAILQTDCLWMTKDHFSLWQPIFLYPDTI